MNYWRVLSCWTRFIGRCVARENYKPRLQSLYKRAHRTCKWNCFWLTSQGDVCLRRQNILHAVWSNRRTQLMTPRLRQTQCCCCCCCWTDARRGHLLLPRQPRGHAHHTSTPPIAPVSVCVDRRAADSAVHQFTQSAHAPRRAAAPAQLAVSRYQHSIHGKLLSSPVYTIQPVVKRVVKPVIQRGLTTGWTNSGCSFNTVVKPVVWQPVWQPVVSCKRGITVYVGVHEHRYHQCTRVKKDD